MATTTSIPQGRGLLRDPRFNRGTAFTAEDRTALGLEGLLPATVLSLEEQAERSYEQYRAQPTDLARNEFLAALHDRNEVLYYKLLEEHLKEMLPVVWHAIRQLRSATDEPAQAPLVPRAQRACSRSATFGAILAARRAAASSSRSSAKR